MLLNKTCFYSKILHANAVLEHANAVFDDTYAYLEPANVDLENQVFWGVSNRDMLLIETCFCLQLYGNLKCG